MYLYRDPVCSVTIDIPLRRDSHNDRDIILPETFNKLASDVGI